VLAFGDTDKSDWIETVVISFESLMKPLLSEEKLMAYLPSVQVLGDGQPIVLVTGETPAIAVKGDIKPEITNSLEMRFVYIPPGEFMMGSPKDEPGRWNNEIQHKVTLTKGYYMQTTEVTQGQWKAIMGSNPSYFKDCGDTCPVENVSWDDAQTFIEKLNQKEGTDKYRLPTEAEWAYAARAGTKTAYHWGDKPDCSKANYGSGWSDECKGKNPGKTVRAASFLSNDWGLYDMHGNVWEWCQDWYGNYPADAVTDPAGPGTGSSRVLRGGGWNYGARNCRSGYRGYNTPDSLDYSVGFRFARFP